MREHYFQTVKSRALFAAGLLALSLTSALSQPAQLTPNYKANTRFEQLGADLPTPNTYRTAAGAPGRDYWQQRADYQIKVELNDEQQRITGSETITYFNQSPDALPYLWLQLEQNRFASGSLGNNSSTGGIDPNGMSPATLSRIANPNPKPYGYNIRAVRDAQGKALPYTINNTMMRIDLPQPVRPGQRTVFSVEWDYLITPYARSGYEYFPKDGNYNYFIAHWFPRLAAYNDVNGWQHKQFLGTGEFTLIFGNYQVAITVPNDHVVGATGELQNAREVLSATQQKRLDQARNNYKEPVLIVTQAEAVAAEKAKNPTGKKTWVFKADNVRDFAFTSSRKFIWDAMNVDIDGKKTMAMSFYSKEGNPLWGKYSTRVVAHTIRSYGARTIPYPYPVAISCHANLAGGMEYPMISFNGYRPEEDGTYAEQTKNSMIGVIIHEVGHNFFPMIVNSDERQWGWMDEGLNSFCQYLAEKEWDVNFPSRYGEPQLIVSYMKTDPNILKPIMSSSDNIMLYGPNAYNKPAAGLNILRETIMGRDLFDYAFKEYARRWAFKTPMPADFFRTMEDASGVDLDWFWKGWFYSTEPADQDLVEVKWFQLNSQNPDIVKAEARAEAERRAKTVSKMRDAATRDQTVVAQDSSMRDFYNRYDPYTVTDADRRQYADYLNSLSAEERKLVESKQNFYTLSVKNKGGLVMPVIIRMEFEDGTDSTARFPAEIWRFNDQQLQKVIATDKKVVQWTLDPYFEIADIDTENNSFPRKAQPTRLQLFKQQQGRPRNPMQQSQSPASSVGSSRN